MTGTPEDLSNGNAETITRVKGRRLVLLWMIWIAAALLMGFVIFASIRQFIHEGLYGGPLTDKIISNGLSPAVFFPFEFTLSAIQLIVWCLTALLILYRRRDDWLVIVASIMFLTLGYFFTRFPGVVFPGHIPPDLVYLDNLHWFIITIQWISVLIFFGTFPDGRFVPRWILPVFALFALQVIVEDTIIIIDPNLEAFPDYSFLIRVIVMPVLLIYAQLYRRKQMGGIERQQTKFALAGFILGNLGYIIEQLTLENRTLFLLPEPTLYLTMRPLAFLLFMCAATCFTYAVLRYHLWDIDFVINRSLVYSALTVLLGSVFAAGFFALRAFMQAIFQTRQDLIAVAIPAVMITALFTPTRKALRRFVDQRIYGIQLDYEEVADDRAVKHLQSPLDPKISFGIYKDMELVGRGGMSEVYCAYHPILKRRVAIKILSKNLLLDEIARKRFDHEAQAISMLSHPNIVTCYEYNEHDGVPYMVLEFLEGQALSQIIRKSGRLPLNEALPILRDVASALDFAHAHGIIHRDVKPSNVIVEQKQAAAGGQNQRAVLTDFGIAKLYNVTHLTSTGNMLGSLDYVSPEQIRGAGEADMRSDIYSFGVMAYEMLTGTLPFGHGNPGALVMAHLLTPPPDPRTKIPDLPAPAAEALLRAMAKDPQSRQKTVQDLVMALEQCDQIQHTASMQATEVLGDVV